MYAREEIAEYFLIICKRNLSKYELFDFIDKFEFF